MKSPCLRWYQCEIGAHGGLIQSLVSEVVPNTTLKVQVEIELQLHRLNHYDVRDYASDAGGFRSSMKWEDLPLATAENLFLQPAKG